jgi:hypothetical protein
MRSRLVRLISRSQFDCKVLGFANWSKAFYENETNLDKGNVRVAAYLCLLAVQVLGALAFIWKELPAFNQLLRSPGEQLPFIAFDDLTTAGILVSMQIAYWYRLKCVAIPFRGPNPIASHLFLFLGRLSFIFGGALFAVVFFRHLPALDDDADALLMTPRGLLLGGALFALFCLTLELERLGHALEVNHAD